MRIQSTTTPPSRPPYHEAARTQDRALTGRACSHANGWYHTVRFWRWERRYFACHDCAELVPITGWVFKWYFALPLTDIAMPRRFGVA